MPVSVARIFSVPVNPLRASYCASLAALLVFLGCESLQNATAEGDTRTISLHHMHTGEDLTITYKVNGRYDDDALDKINHVLRDWRKNEVIKMDPHLIDLVWEVQRDVSAKGPIQVVCGYRSPDTNAMLRRRSSGVAKFSQHMLGKAMDFYIPGVPLEQLRAVGLYLEKGGVGYYPSSGSPFVHMDTGNVRHWPAIASGQMPTLVAKGRELHMAASNAPASGRQAVVAAVAPAPAKPAVVAAAPAPAKPTVVAAVEPKPVPVPQSRPAAKAASFELASVTSRPVDLAPPKAALARPAQAASLVTKGDVAADDASANSIIDQRGYWQGAPEQGEQPLRPPAPIKNVSGGVQVANATGEMDATGTLAPWPIPERSGTNGVLAYATPGSPNAPAPASRNAPMGALQPATRAVTAQPDTTVAVKRSGDRPTTIVSPVPVAAVAAPRPSGAIKVGEKFNDPWMRAMIISPSAQHFLSTSLFGTTDFRALAAYMHKPTTGVMMTFSEDPHLGMSFTRFGGTAIVFVPTVTFSVRTAALR